MENVAFILFFLLGFLAAALGNLAGIAGGIFIVPTLLLMGFPAADVIGSVQASLILPMILASIDGFRRKEVNIKFALIFEISTVTGAWIGAFFTRIIPEILMKLIFSMLAFFFSVLIFRQARNMNSSQEKKQNKTSSRTGGDSPLEERTFMWMKKLNARIRPRFTMTLNGSTVVVSIPLMIVFGFMIGFLAGMLGIAGGWLKTPLMMLVYDFTPHAATATALFMALLTVTGGSIAHFYYGHVNLGLTLPLTLGLTIGSLTAIKIKHRLSSKRLPKIIAIMLALVGLILLISTIFSV